MSGIILLIGNAVIAQTPATETKAIDTILAFWPFVVVLVLLLLTVLWYQNIKTMRRGRETGRHRPAGANPVLFLGIVTVFVLILLALPWYLNNLEEKKEVDLTETTEIAPENRVETVFLVEGMTCSGCENAINRRVKELQGVKTVEADHVARQTIVVFDKSKVDEERIIGAITEAGYTVIGKLE